MKKKVMIFFVLGICIVPFFVAAEDVEKKYQDKELELLRRLGQMSQQQEGLLREIKMGLTFVQSLEDVEWVESKNFSPSGWSANFSFLYVLLRVLNDFCPTSILELGVGQTTKLTSQFANHNPNIALTVVDHDKYWIDLMLKKIKVTKNMMFLELPLCPAEFNDKKTMVYKDLAKNVDDKKFDFIIVDGGDGDYRTSFFDLIPKNLKKSFVIILDDFHYADKKETVKALQTILKNFDIKYDTLIVKGQKQQFVVFSSDIVFLKHL
jgi:predicted O-methyltransferase YrrM